MAASISLELVLHVYRPPGAATLETSLKCLKHLGTMLSFGSASGEVMITPTLLRVMRNCTCALACSTGHPAGLFVLHLYFVSLKHWLLAPAGRCPLCASTASPPKTSSSWGLQCSLLWRHLQVPSETWLKAHDMIQKGSLKVWIRFSAQRSYWARLWFLIRAYTLSIILVYLHITDYYLLASKTGADLI